MVAKRITWLAKAAKLCGWPRKGAATALATRIGEKPRTVYGWFDKGHVPQNEREVLRKIAEAYAQQGVTVEWLDNGRDDEPPHVGPGVTAAFLRAVEESGLPTRAKRVLMAMTDPDVAEWIADAYERLYVPQRRRS